MQEQQFDAGVSGPNWPVVLGALTAAGAVVGGVTYLYGRYIEAHHLEIVHQQFEIPNLPDALDGFTIVQLSDFHLRPHTKPAFVEKIVEKANALSADLIALTGDYVCKDASAILELAPILAKLKSRFGIYAVLGNHDVDRGYPVTQEIIAYGLEQSGIKLLVNEHVVLPNGLVLVGLDECYDGMPDMRTACEGLDPTRPIVLLMHQPDYADVAARYPNVILQLSGHTHGGQVRPPLLQPLYLPIYGRKYVIGRYRVGNMWLYVNRGIGLAFYGPMRLRCRPELTHITLRKQS